MTPGHRIPTDTSTTRRLRRWAPALALCATALLSACSDDDKKDPPGDTTPPTVTITDDTDGVASGDVTFSFTFSEDVGTSFAASDVTVSAGAKGALVKASATLYRIVVTPPENAAGDLTVSVPVGAFTDTSGNANTAGASTTQAYDTAAALQQMDLPLSFDAPDVEYGVVPFDGATADLAADPGDAGNTVVQIVKPAAAALWAGAKLVTVVDTTEVGLASRIPFDADNTRMTMRVYAPAAGAVVLLKLEVSGSDPVVAVETQATTTQANAWETLTFDFANPSAGADLDVAADYDRIAIFPAFMTAGAGESYYFDDVTFIGGGGTGGGPDPFQTVDFDTAGVAYSLVGFGGADDSAVIVDPDDAANHIARVTKSATAETWAGTTIVTGAANTVGVIPFDASNTRMSVRVWSPDAGITVRLKAEDHTAAAVNVETEAVTTLANAWETLTFEFATPVATPLDPAQTYDRLSIFFNFGVGGATAGEKTYYFDDVVFVGGTTEPPAPFSTVTFDDPTKTYTLTGFGGAEDSALADDPVAGAGNQVARVNRSATAATWAGTTVSTGANASVGTIPFDASNVRMTVRVYSPDSGIKVRLKVEDSTDNTRTCETEATTTTAGEWETLTFDFASPASGTAALNFAFTYDKASIFFNFGVDGATAGAKTYYFDDVAFIGGTTPTPGAFSTVTFDDAGTTYTLTGFGGADDSTVADDPVAGAGNQVARVNKSATAETWAGTTVSTGPNESVGTIPFDASNVRMTVRVYSPDAGIKVRLKVEDAADNTHTCETEATTTAAGAWETLTFDFASPAVGTAAMNFTYTFNKVSIFFNFGVNGATAGAKTYYFDDVAFIGGTSGGGGGTEPAAAPTAPTAAAADVISLFSATYDGTAGDYDASVDSYHASCFGPPGNTVADFTIAGTSHVVKEYTMAANSFAIIEFIGATGGTATPPDSAICGGGSQTGANVIDASQMTRIHFDVWSPTGSNNFQVHLVDSTDPAGLIPGPGAPAGTPGANNTASGALTVAAGQWVSFDVPFSTMGPPPGASSLDMVGLVKFFTTDGGTFFIDNVYFSK